MAPFKNTKHKTKIITQTEQKQSNWFLGHTEAFKNIKKQKKNNESNRTETVKPVHWTQQPSKTTRKTTQK